MNMTIPYEDAIDLLETDHKAVKGLFIQYGALHEDAAPPKARQAVANQICRALTIHTQIEEEIFYPKVREAIAADGLMDEALHEHAEAKQIIAQILRMSAANKQYDGTVKMLAKVIDQHVLEEREEMFLYARRAPLDLRGLAVPLFARKKQLEKAAASSAKEES